MNEDFINAFIENMNKKIEELTRQEIMLSTRLMLAEKALQTSLKENLALQQENEKLATGLNKKVAKQNKDDF